MSATNNSRPDKDEIAESGLVPQLAVMRRGLWASPTRNTVALLAVALFIVIAATAYGQIRLNSWNQPFYDALSRRDSPRFLVELGVFGIIAGALLVLNVAQRWLGEMLKLKLRQGLVQDLVQNWLVPVRAFRIANAGDIGANPDQRMHEDARRLTELSAELGIGLLQGSILLITFISVLWGISSEFVFHVAGRMLAIPGYMVWAASDAGEIVRLATFLFGAGQDTSAKLLGNSMCYIVEQPGLQDQLRENPSLIPQLLEEVLRLEGSTKQTARLARRDTRIGQLKIPTGTKVMLALAAGNRDPRRWENPQDLILNRPRIKEHIAFGRGKHVCAGAPLARVEVRIILEKFLEHSAAVELDANKHGPRGARTLDYEPSFIIRGLANLNLKLAPAPGFVPSAPQAR